MATTVPPRPVGAQRVTRPQGGIPPRGHVDRAVMRVTHPLQLLAAGFSPNALIGPELIGRTMTLRMPKGFGTAGQKALEDRLS